jgi:hypothetical protein
MRADLAAHVAVPAVLGRVAEVAALHLDDEKSAVWIDDDEVEFAGPDGVGILDEQVLDDDPRSVDEGVLEALAHDELGLVRGSLLTLAANLVGDAWKESRHAGAKCKRGPARRSETVPGTCRAPKWGGGRRGTSV